MSTKQLSTENLRKLIHEGKANDPLAFFEAIMSGQDPRQTSKIFDLVHEINDFSGMPDESDWKEIVKWVDENYKYGTVSISESHSAAKSLAEYLHPKRKQVDINSGSSATAKLPELTAEEVELFKEEWNEEF